MGAAKERSDGDTRALSLLEAQLADLETKREELTEETATLGKALSSSSLIEKALDRLNSELSSWRSHRDELLEKRGALMSQLERCEQIASEVERLDRQLELLQKESAIYGHLEEAFGKDGIQALVIEGANPEIEREANAILRKLTDNRIQMAVESLRDLKGGGTRETLDIRIADEIGERSYHLFSGGEAFRADFALRIALSKVLARRCGTRLRTLIIDEGFGTQDGRGLEHLKEAIQAISADFDKLLVVTHLPELKDAFPVQIEVSKLPEIGSRLEVLGLG